MAGKFEIRKSGNGQFFFNLKAGNGDKILTSEIYMGKSSAFKKRLTKKQLKREATHALTMERSTILIKPS